MPGMVVHIDRLERLIARLRQFGSDTPNVEVKSAHGGLPESVDETLCSSGNLPDYTLSQLEIDGFIANRTRPQFDEAEVPGASVEDLDRERLADFLATARNLDRRLAPIHNDTELLLKTGVILRSHVPTVAGLLALGTYPQQFLRYFTIRAALLPADARPSTRALDSANFTGPVGAMLEDAVAWVHKNSRVQVRVDTSTGHVRDQADPPVVAVRELISNALVHRDLAEWATSRAIELRMSPSEFRLTNPGGLLGIAVDRLGIHPLTSARNRLLIDVCKFVRTADGKVVEALATGRTTGVTLGAGQVDPTIDAGVFLKPAVKPGTTPTSVPAVTAGAASKLPRTVSSTYRSVVAAGLLAEIGALFLFIDSRRKKLV